MKLFKKAKKGFTLVELVVVIAVIAILAAVSVGAYFGVTGSANNSQADQEAKALHTAIMLVVSDPESGYTVDNDGTLADADSYDAFVSKVTGVTGIEYNFNETTPNEKLATIAIDEHGIVSYTTTKGSKYIRYINVKTGAIDTTAEKAGIVVEA